MYRAFKDFLMLNKWSDKSEPVTDTDKFLITTNKNSVRIETESHKLLIEHRGGMLYLNGIKFLRVQSCFEMKVEFVDDFNIGVYIYSIINSYNLGLILNDELDIQGIYVKQYDILRGRPYSRITTSSFETESLKALVRSNDDYEMGRVFFRVLYKDYKDFLQYKESLGVLDPQDMVLEVYDSESDIQRLVETGFKIPYLSSFEHIKLKGLEIRMLRFDCIVIGNKKLCCSWKDDAVTYDGKKLIRFDGNYGVLILENVLIFEGMYCIMVSISNEYDSDTFKLVLFIGVSDLSLRYFLYNFDKCASDLSLHSDASSMYSKSKLLLGIDIDD